MLVIGIAGGTGSGKTTVVKKIIEGFGNDEVAILSQDSYYRDNAHLPLEERKELNFDHPNSLEFELLVEHIKDLKAGKSINEPIYSYLSCTRADETNIIKPKKVIIVEGILVLTNPELRNIFDIKIFVHASADDRLVRVIKRDTIERGRDVYKVLERYHKTVKPMHDQFIEPSKDYADLILPQGGENKVAINVLATVIEKKLSI
jgi:uridine kinase